MATKAEVEFWKDQCRKLTAALNRSIKDKDELTARLLDNSEEAKTARAVADGLEWRVEELEVKNAKLRELVSLMYEREVTARQCVAGCGACGVRDGVCERIGALRRELGIEVDE